MLTFILVILFLFIVFINAAGSLKSNWAFFYDTKMFRNFFPYKKNECTTIKHPLNKQEEPPELPVAGFNSLFISPKSSYNRGIETISLAKGKKNCKSYGYTNVDGNLCLSKCQLKSLQTRGKNDPDAVIDFLK
jgi:hypothetical protein